jgi:membrane dipeptidase
MSPAQAGRWWECGLRVAGLAHYGPGVYACGTGGEGPVTEAGKELLQAFERLGIILDATHLCDRSFFEALELYSGPVLASHNNCRALVNANRQFSDEQIGLLANRGAVIGVALDAWMLYPGWRKGETSPDVLSLDAVADHVDHIRKVTGSIRHVAIGSDLDGNFGSEQTPGDCKSIEDLERLSEILTDRGYKQDEVDAVFYKNWTDFFKQNLPSGI